MSGVRAQLGPDDCWSVHQGACNGIVDSCRGFCPNCAASFIVPLDFSEEEGRTAGVRICFDSPSGTDTGGPGRWTDVAGGASHVDSGEGPATDAVLLLLIQNVDPE